VITRVGAAVLVSLALSASVGASDAIAKDESSASRCGAGTKLTPHAELRGPLQIVDGPGLIGNGTLWTIPLRPPEYGPGAGNWVLGKQAWFRLEEGPLTVTGRRVDGGSGTFHAAIPPVESYPLALNAGIGPGFIPSSLEFSTGGCWKVTARLGQSRVVLVFDIDDSKTAICAQLASDLRVARASSDQWSQTQVGTITTDQQTRRCGV
jgi:hypothetical protein